MYSNVIMEFTTPASYGNTVVRVGGIATEGKLLYAGTTGLSVEHTEKKQDSENDWPEPSAVKCHWEGKTDDGKEISADLTSSLGPRYDRVDVMAEVPGFVKTIVASAVGTKPYIYQFAPKATIEVKVGDEIQREEGNLFMEATFIS
jgi:hypothetical protein